MKKAIRNIGFLGLLLAMVACQEEVQPDIKPAYCPSKITISMPQAQEQLIYVDETEASVLPLLVGERVQMSCALEPDSVTFNQVIWSSSNEQVVTVTQDGLITAVSEAGTGYSVISVVPVGMYTGSGVSSTLKVRVSSTIVPATAIALSATTDSIYIGETSTLKASVLPTNSTYRTVSWTSSNESIATVDSKGVVTGVSVPEGEVSAPVIITAHALDGSDVVASDTLVVMKIVDPTAITIDQRYAKASYACCMQEKSLVLEYTTVPANATKSKITWTSSDPSIATVNNGVVTFNQDGNFGEFTITATCPNGEQTNIEMNMPVGLIRELFANPKNITWHDAAQSGNNTVTSTKWNDDSTITVTTFSQNATKQRADIKCYATPVYICPATYPMVAIRMEDVKDKYKDDGVTARNINLDSSGEDTSDGSKFSGNVGGGNNKYAYDLKCSDGSHVFVYDLSTQSFGNGGLFPADHVGKFTTFQFKHADIATIDHQITFNVYWVQSFKSLQEVKDYLTSEGLTWE